MTLNEKDLAAIKDLIEFSNEQNKQEIIREVSAVLDVKLEEKLEEKFGKSREEIYEVIHREVSSISDVNSHFSNRLDNHEKRITNIEIKNGLKPLVA